MTEEKKDDNSAEDGTSGASSGDDRGKGRRMGDGIRQGIGVLSAFKDALEETIQEARDRGDLSADRAKEVMKDALGKAQVAAEEAKTRLDFATQVDMDAVRTTVESMKGRLAELEESVFGASKEPADEAPPADSGPKEKAREQE